MFYTFCMNTGYWTVAAYTRTPLKIRMLEHEEPTTLFDTKAEAEEYRQRLERKAKGMAGR